jgi:hypothetical protein
MIGARNISALPATTKKAKTTSFFVSRFSPDVFSQDNILEEQLKLFALTCARLRTKFHAYASFHISINEKDFPLISNTGLWQNGCLMTPLTAA